MLSFVTRRLLHAALVLGIVSFLVFALIHALPGDPALTMLGLHASPAEVEALRSELGLDEPLVTQYFRWLRNLAAGDLGTSIMYRENIAELIARRLPITIYISSLALVFATVLGMAGGVTCAWKRGSAADRLISLLASLGMSVPVFWLGIVGIYFFALTLGWLPVQGYTSPREDLWLSLSKALMPAFCLAVVPLSALTRQTRSSMLDVVHSPYIAKARAIGASEPRVLLKHVLRNGLIPVITLIGIYLRYIVGGSVIVETVFNIPGMGRTIVQAVFDKDFVIVQASILVIAIVVLAGNLIVDISYGLLDPRIRARLAAGTS